MVFFLFISFYVSSCTSPDENNKQANVQRDSSAFAKEVRQSAYKPGLGELMSAIQMHHGKLWFAGINNNWKLAEYETGEIKEILTSAEEIETDRPEVKDIHTVYPSLDSVTISITQQNLPLFKARFGKLTESCNNCHNNHHFEFNRIIIPQSPPVTNQDFKPH